MNALATTANEWDTLVKLATVFLKSGLLPSEIKTAEQAILIMRYGGELGVEPLQALSHIPIIKGKPSVSPLLMLALAERSGELEDMAVDVNEERAIVTMKRKGRSPHTETFSMKDAQRMKTKEDGKVIALAEKFNWRSMPTTMMKWRAIGACCKVLFGDIILNLQRKYAETVINMPRPFADSEQATAFLVQMQRAWQLDTKQVATALNVTLIADYVGTVEHAESLVEAYATGEPPMKRLPIKTENPTPTAPPMTVVQGGKAPTRSDQLVQQMESERSETLTAAVSGDGSFLCNRIERKEKDGTQWLVFHAVEPTDGFATSFSRSEVAGLRDSIQAEHYNLLENIGSQFVDAITVAWKTETKKDGKTNRRAIRATAAVTEDVVF